MREFTTIFWDVDGTLLDFHYSQRCSLQQCFHSINRELTEEMIHRYSQINDAFWKKLELGEVSKDELLKGRFLQLFEEYDITGVELPSFLRQYQEGLGNNYQFIDDSLTICKSLYGRVKQYVITNGVTVTQNRKLKLSGLADVMEDIFISERIGAPKPQKEFFDYCMAHAKEKDKSRILIVGDSLSSDIKGGVQAGIPTCWYRPDETENSTEYIPDYEINDLHRIYDILNVFG